MSWVNDLAGGLGIQAGAATVAVAMYAACTAAEKAARPGALKEIGLTLKNRPWFRTGRPSSQIERIFNATFGQKHLSFRCAATSLIATYSVVYAMALVLGVQKDFFIIPALGGILISAVPT